MIHVYLAGDSTVQTYKPEAAPQAGWGQFIANHYDCDNVQFHNKAIGGRSSKSFIVEGRLDAIRDELGEGDFLLIQMGHNDSTVSKPERYTEPHTEYPGYLRQYIETARAKRATPILITPVARLHLKDGSFVNDFPDYCAAMKRVAEEQAVPLIDLMALSLERYTAMGYDEARKLFMVSHNGTDHTHFTEAGAQQIATLLERALSQIQSFSPNKFRKLI